MPPITSIIWHLAIATIYPPVRWWAVTFLDVCTFVGNSLYIIYETSYYRWSRIEMKRSEFEFDELLDGFGVVDYL